MSSDAHNENNTPYASDAEAVVALRGRYLLGMGNCAEDIKKLENILRMPQILLEVGCGNADAAIQIARKNPGVGLVATDLYDGSLEKPGEYSYGATSREWRDHQLTAQLDSPANLVILRAEAELLRFLPNGAIDTVFLLNPEPRMGKAFLELLRKDALLSRIRLGSSRIVILPYSRQLGVAVCGGCYFEHDPDWSRGLGFLMGSGFRFQRCASIQWGVDLSRISLFAKHSTQKNVYIYGEAKE